MPNDGDANGPNTSSFAFPVPPTPTFPDSTGEVRVLFVSVSVVARPTNVSVAGGSVSVTLPEYALCGDDCSAV
ncbi:MAG: hypothetical protein VXX72_05380 [Pseudomonadota bacterium]|nr:hypothetical protein [Pseudomonadota bacterium]